MAQEKRGKLLVIDGIDGSGKATQASLLTKRLRQEGYEVETLDFPQYYNNFFGSIIGKYLRGEFDQSIQINPYIASILYAADRWESSPLLSKWLSSGKIVVLDRYVSANMGHQGSKIKEQEKRAEFLKWLEEMEFKIYKIARPDLNILLHLKPEIAQILVDKKSTREYTKGKKKDSHESDIEYLKSTSECFLDIAKNSQAWKIIDCNAQDGTSILPIEDIHEKVWKIVLPEIQENT